MVAALADKKLVIRAGRDAGGSHEIAWRRKPAVVRGGFACEGRILPERVAMGVDGNQASARAKKDCAVHEQRNGAPLMGAAAGGPLDAAVVEAEGFHSIARGCVEESIANCAGVVAIGGAWIDDGNPALRAGAIEGKYGAVIVGDIDCAIGTNRGGRHRCADVGFPLELSAGIDRVDETVLASNNDVAVIGEGQRAFHPSTESQFPFLFERRSLSRGSGLGRGLAAARHARKRSKKGERCVPNRFARHALAPHSLRGE